MNETLMHPAYKKAIDVIFSSKLEHLNAASNYADLAVKQVGKDLGHKSHDLAEITLSNELITHFAKLRKKYLEN